MAQSQKKKLLTVFKRNKRAQSGTLLEKFTRTHSRTMQEKNILKRIYNNQRVKLDKWVLIQDKSHLCSQQIQRKTQGKTKRRY